MMVTPITLNMNVNVMEIHHHYFVFTENRDLKGVSLNRFYL